MWQGDQRPLEATGLLQYLSKIWLLEGQVSLSFGRLRYRDHACRLYPDTTWRSHLALVHKISVACKDKEKTQLDPLSAISCGVVSASNGCLN